MNWYDIVVYTREYIKYILREVQRWPDVFWLSKVKAVLDVISSVLNQHTQQYQIKTKCNWF